VQRCGKYTEFLNWDLRDRRIMRIFLGFIQHISLFIILNIEKSCKSLSDPCLHQAGTDGVIQNKKNPTPSDTVWDLKKKEEERKVELRQLYKP